MPLYAFTINLEIDADSEEQAWDLAWDLEEELSKVTGEGHDNVTAFGLMDDCEEQ